MVILGGGRFLMSEVPLLGLEVRGLGLGFRVWSLGFGVQGLGFLCTSILGDI